MAKILIIVTNVSDIPNTEKKTGWYLPEVAHAYEVFVQNGFLCDFASPKGGEAPVDPGSAQAFAKDTICTKFLENEEASKALKNTLSVSDVKVEDYVALYFAGGHGPLWDIPDNEQVNTLTAKFYESNKIVSAVCHGPIGLVNVKLSNGEYLVKGKSVTGFTNAEEAAINFTSIVPYSLQDKLTERGANFTNGENWKAHVASSERLFTGQNPASTTPLAQEIVNSLKK